MFIISRIAPMMKIAIKIHFRIAEYGIEYGGLTSDFSFAFFTMERIRIAINPPASTPPIPNTFVNSAD